MCDSYVSASLHLREVPEVSTRVGLTTSRWLEIGEVTVFFSSMERDMQVEFLDRLIEAASEAKKQIVSDEGGV